MGTPATILLVEDDQSLQEGISDLLEIAKMGYDITVITASDGRDGLEAMRTITPDLIISDIMMPHMNGFEFLAAVREKTQWLHVPFIFLTAKGKRQDILKGKLSGAELYITKPFDSTELLEMVQTQLDRSFSRQEAQKESLQAFKRSILQLLNHEFRTPLTYVTAYYEMLIDSLAIYEDMENLDTYLQGIYAGCARLNNLLNSLILVVDIRTGAAAQTFQQEAHPINNIVALFKSAVEEVEEKAAEDIIFTYDVDRALPTVYGVKDHLNLIFKELVQNATKFMAYKLDGTKEITLSAWTADKHVYFSVKDNGIGISPSYQDKIFDLFYQYRRDYFEQQGPGAGLSIVKGLIELHHGSIKVESEENAGCTFTIDLPMYVPGQSPQHGSHSSQSRKVNLLVVEDDYYLLDGLKELLEIYDGPYELEVRTATDGREGLAAVEHHQPDLIISDIMMPNMDGYELLSRIRENREWLHIPFIFLTAKGDPTDIRKGQQSGVEQYITKPYDSDELLDLITTQLDRYHQLMEVASEGFDELKQNILNLLQPTLQAPLDLVTNYSEDIAAALNQAETPDSFKQALQGIQEGSHQISEVVEDFIALAEIKTGEAHNAFNLRAEPIPNLGMLLQMAAQGSEGEAQAAGITFETSQAGGKLSPVKIDYDGFFKGLQRFIAAMLKACQLGNGSTIYLKAEERTEEIRLIAWHNGNSVSEELRQKIKALFTINSEKGIMGAASFGPQLCLIKGIADVNQAKIFFGKTEDGFDQYVIVLPLYQEHATMSM